jgi:excisionase family DNA binding protein
MSNAGFSLPCVVPVAGVSFRQDAVHRIRVGDPLVVRRDPLDPYDRQAVVIETAAGMMVGYLPRTLQSRAVADLYDAEVAEKLTAGDIVGVRVRLLRPRTPVDPGIAGDDAPEAQPAPVTVPEPVAVRIVTTLTGRELGVFLGAEDDHVLVGRDGTDAIYPARLVVIGEPFFPVQPTDATHPVDVAASIAATPEPAGSPSDQVDEPVALLGATDLARALGVAVGTVHRWARTGRIPVVTVSGRRRFDRDAVAAALTPRAA